MFVGRTRELSLLHERVDKGMASLIVCKGRRRIGKSRLFQEFGKTLGSFYEFQGAAPTPAGRYVTSLDNLPAWKTIAGLQFENLVLANIPRVLELLSVPIESINNAGPYFQSANKRRSGTQIDLLVDTKHTIYICEVKFRESIDTKVIKNLKQKIENLKIPSHKSIRPVLIYEGSINETILKEDFFDTVISFDQLMSA